MWFKRFGAGLLAATGCATVLLGVAAAAPPDLREYGDIHESIGQVDTRPLQHNVAYQASGFPFPVRIRPPDTRWGGGQYESGAFRFVQLNHLRTGTQPLHGVGYVTLESSTGPTPSVASTVARLRTTPHIDAGPVTPVRIAGFGGRSFDATIVGSDRPSPLGVSFAPFKPNHHCGFCTKTMQGETQDAKWAGEGQLFRIDVIDVRGKTVVVYIESNFADQRRYPPQKVFPTFLPYAPTLLSNLSVPAAS